MNVKNFVNLVFIMIGLFSYSNTHAESYNNKNLYKPNLKTISPNEVTPDHLHDKYENYKYTETIESEQSLKRIPSSNPNDSQKEKINEGDIKTEKTRYWKYNPENK